MCLRLPAISAATTDLFVMLLGAVETVCAFAVASALTSGLEALTVLLLAFRILA